MRPGPPTCQDPVRANLSERVAFKLDTSLPGFPSEDVENVTINVTRLPDNTVIFSESSEDVTGVIEEVWNATNAAVGAYQVQFLARNGRATSVINISVNVTAPPTVGVVNLDSQYTYGRLNSTGDTALYEFNHAVGCGPVFYVNVFGRDSADYNLYATAGASPGTNTALYVEKRESSASAEYIRWEGATPGTYSVLVKHNHTAAADFMLVHKSTLDCQSGGATEQTPDRDVMVNRPDGDALWMYNA